MPHKRVVGLSTGRHVQSFWCRPLKPRVSSDTNHESERQLIVRNGVAASRVRAACGFQVSNGTRSARVLGGWGRECRSIS